MNFIPDTPKDEKKDVPFFENVSSKDGWQGQSTTKSIARLKIEIIQAVERLGGHVQGFQSGNFQDEKHPRQGFRLLYFVEGADGKMYPGRIDIAALPVENTWNERLSEKSLKMALYMLRIALEGTWFLQQLSPGYAPLMPWMLVDGEKTVTQLWGESSVMNNLLPAGDDNFVVEGEYKPLE